MGKTLLGGISHEGNVDMLNADQQDFLSSILQQGNNPGQFQDMFQKSFMDPAQQGLQRSIIPQIKENFMGMDESGSSALNRALAQSATDLSSSMGQGMMNQFNQQQNLGMQGLNRNTFDPMINNQKGLLPGLLNLLSGYMDQRK